MVGISYVPRLLGDAPISSSTLPSLKMSPLDTPVILWSLTVSESTWHSPRFQLRVVCAYAKTEEEERRNRSSVFLISFIVEFLERKRRRVGKGLESSSSSSFFNTSREAARTASGILIFPFLPLTEAILPRCSRLLLAAEVPISWYQGQCGEEIRCRSPTLPVPKSIDGTGHYAAAVGFSFGDYTSHVRSKIDY
ncbi:hypothetical protein KSP40_PGU008849 [Platanthera guangdongensis]|uniref:Uncharacterized protein n=1 Tax=Platanthera guangdongensis TaxID=2320717 RepID=A0ABR2MPD0_9ASPA